MLNQYLMELNSGVEFAEINRLRLLKDADIPAKIVTRDYNPSLHHNLDLLKIADTDVINMYDFFQETQAVEEKYLRTTDLDFAHQYAVEQGANFSRVSDEDHIMADVYFLPGTVGRVDYINYYDEFGHTAMREHFDWRGFKSMDEYFTPTGEPVFKAFYKVNGKKALEEYYMQNSEGGTVVSLLKLIDYKGQDYNFDNLDEIFTFFLDELNKSEGKNQTFIADRPAETNLPMLNMATPARKYLSLPILHSVERSNQLSGPIDPVYEVALKKRLHELSGIIVMTNAQRSDLLQNLKQPKIPVYVLPGAYVPEQSGARIPVKNRIENKLIFVGRLGEEKKIDQIIRAFSIVEYANSNTSLDIYGYGDKDYVDGLKELISSLKLDGKITIKGYQQSLDEVYDSAQLFISANHSDAMPIAMVDALGHGVPVVTFDDHYGPKEIVKNGVDGLLIKDGDLTTFAKAILELLDDKELLQQFSDQAYSNSTKDFGRELLAERWDELLNA
ncbi:hypothetical protein IV79_GL001625 [Pediococcus claussenii]|nr:hypothetical protein IV79_GL001625 [Pediococcus claussenii]